VSKIDYYSIIMSNFTGTKNIFIHSIFIKIMKTLRIFFLCLIFPLFPITNLYGDNDEHTYEVPLTSKDKPNTNRPHKPMQHTPKCVYTNGYLHISSESQMYGTINITNDNNEIIYNQTNCPLYPEVIIFIGDAENYFEITVQIGNTTFQGNLCI